MTLPKWPLRFERPFQRSVQRQLCPGRPWAGGPAYPAHRWQCLWLPCEAGAPHELPALLASSGYKEHFVDKKKKRGVAKEKLNICVSRALHASNGTLRCYLPGCQSCELFCPTGPAPPQTPPRPASTHLSAMLGWTGRPHSSRASLSLPTAPPANHLPKAVTC